MVEVIVRQPHAKFQMTFSQFNDRPPYYQRRTTEHFLKYFFRLVKAILAMYPRARQYGLRYYFDTEYRRRIQYRQGRYKKDQVRRWRAGSFKSKKTKNKLKKRLISRDGHFCNLCREALEKDKLTIDHILPLFLGGASNLENLQLLCEPCHRMKSRQEDQKG